MESCFQAAAVRPIPTVSVNGRNYDEVSHLAALTIQVRQAVHQSITHVPAVQGAFKRMKGKEAAESAAESPERPPDVITS